MRSLKMAAVQMAPKNFNVIYEKIMLDVQQKLEYIQAEENERV